MSVYSRTHLLIGVAGQIFPQCPHENVLHIDAPDGRFHPDGSRGDLPKLATLLKQAENSFPEIVDTVEKEHTFSSKTTTKWKCLCGTDNAMDVGGCKRCKRDRRGFKPNDTTPEKAKTILDRKIKALQRRLS